MRRRTFVSSVAAFVCLPFPILRRKCPYRIEEVANNIGYRFYDENQLVGWYWNAINSNLGNWFTITKTYSAQQINKRLNQIIPGNHKMLSCAGRFNWSNKNNELVAEICPGVFFDDINRKRVALSHILYLRIHQDFTPEQAAWRLYEIRQILDT